MPELILRLLYATTAVCFCLSSVQANEQELNELETYVKTADDAFSWRVHSKQAGFFNQNVVIELTSQNWLTEDDVHQTEWKHWINLIIPDIVLTKYPILFINDGNRSDDPPDVDLLLGVYAVANRTIVADLRSIPNQPLIFHDDGVARTEDDLIAYAWRHLIDTDDMRFIPQGPMVKAVVRAMDSIVDYMMDEEGGLIEKFVLVGGANRGHVAWLTAAMDDRVAGLAPLAADVLNTRESLQHHFASYGFWSDALSDYVYHDVAQKIDADNAQKLINQLDPLNYADRLQMPKLIVNAMGDQLLSPDSSRFYWDELEGSNYLRYIPNTGHALKNSDYLSTLLAFYRALKRDLRLPVYSWRHNADGTFEVTTDLEPTEVRFWQGTNVASRDFRISTFGESFNSEVVEADSDGNYRVDIQVPEIGWTAYMMELTYELDEFYPLKLTTQAYVVPDEVPYRFKAKDLPTSITLLCDATDQNHVNELENHLSDMDVSAFAEGDLTVENRGTRLYINWKPIGRFEPTTAFGEDLEQRDCAVLTYQLESGPDITFPPNTIN